MLDGEYFFMSINLKEKNSKQNNSDPIGKITGFFLFRNLIENYNENKYLNEEKRKGIKKYGVISLVLSLVAILVSVSCLITTLLNINFQGISVVLIMIVSVFGCVVIPLIMSAYAFVFAVLQVRLNRKAVGIFGIVASVLSVICCIILTVFLII